MTSHSRRWTYFVIQKPPLVKWSSSQSSFCHHLHQNISPDSAYSKEGKGLFTSGIVSFAFTTLDKVTPLANGMYQAAKARIESMDPATTPAGLLEQYELMLKRIEPGSGSPGCEFICFPGILSQPCEQYPTVACDREDKH